MELKSASQIDAVKREENKGIKLAIMDPLFCSEIGENLGPNSRI